MSKKMNSKAICVAVGCALANQAVLAQETPTPVAAPAVVAQAAPTAGAQATPAATAPTAGNAASSGQELETIVVTAQRRVETAQRAAVPIDVVSATALVDAGVTQVGRLNDLVPALTVQPTSTGNLIFIRGVGNFTVTPNADPASAFNYDGVYVGRTSGTSGAFFDLERVEVLKGPQGTLYGRNATGGAINVLPVQPKMGEFSSYVRGGFGNYQALNLEGAVNVPIGEQAAARLSVSRVKHDGYLRDGTSDQDDLSVRAQIKANPTSDLTVRLAGDYSHLAGVGTSVSYLGNYRFNPQQGNYLFVPAPTEIREGIFTPAAEAYRRTIGAGPAGRLLTSLAISPFQDNDVSGLNAEIDWDLGFGVLTVIPAWRQVKENYLSSAGAFAYRQRQNSEQYSLEARLNGNRLGIFDYVAGAYLYNEQIDVLTSLSLAAAANFLDNKYNTNSLAPFGRLTANVTDQLRLVGGVRYTQDKKDFSGSTIGNTIVCVAVINGVPTCPNAPLFPFVDGIAQSPIPLPAPNGRPVPILVNGVPTGAIVVRTDRFDDSNLKNSRTTYRAAAELDVAKQSLAYASVETGYRSGGFSPATGYTTFKPEYITAYTVGTKNRFLDSRLQLNGEAFLWDYRNQQISAVRNDNDGRTANITQNIGSSRIRGVEIDGRFLVTSNTLLSTGIQYLNTLNKDFVYQQANTGTPPLVGCRYTLRTPANIYDVDCSGLPAYNSPKWTLNFGAKHTVPVGNFQLVLQADTQYRGERYAGFAYLSTQLLPAVWQTNAQISLEPATKRWSVTAYVRNIEDNHTLVFSSTTPLANALVAGTTPPRTYGVRGEFSF